MPERAGRIVVLGGYGETGRRVCRLLARTAVAEVVIAGRSSFEAERCAAAIRGRAAQGAVAAARADAADSASLRAVLEGAELAVVAAPADDHATTIGRACLEAGCDLISLLSSPRAERAFESLAPRVVESGRRFVTRAGLCPGLPSLLVRAMKSRLPKTRAARIGVSIRLRGYTRPEQVFGLVDAAAEAKPPVSRGPLRRGTAGPRSRVTIDYGPPVGTRVSVPLDLPEVEPLPAQLGLDSLASFAATPNWMADRAARAAVRGLYRIRRGLGRRLVAGLLLKTGNRSAVPPGATVVVEGWPGEGEGGGERTVLRVAHSDVFELTAAVVGACVRQHLQETARAIPGVRMMGHVLDPETVAVGLREAGMVVSWAG